MPRADANHDTSLASMRPSAVKSTQGLLKVGEPMELGKDAAKNDKSPASTNPGEVPGASGLRIATATDPTNVAPTVTSSEAPQPPPTIVPVKVVQPAASVGPSAIAAGPQL